VVVFNLPVKPTMFSWNESAIEQKEYMKPHGNLKNSGKGVDKARKAYDAQNNEKALSCFSCMFETRNRKFTIGSR
jgi:hypothetical protein